MKRTRYLTFSDEIFSALIYLGSSIYATSVERKRLTNLIITNLRVLVGNAFPLSLFRKPVTIEVVTLSEFMMDVRGGTIHSLWGHANTLETASAYAGVDLTPWGTRVAVTLDADGYPQLDGISFRTCWIVWNGVSLMFDSGSNQGNLYSPYFQGNICKFLGSFLNLFFAPFVQFS